MTEYITRKVQRLYCPLKPLKNYRNFALNKIRVFFKKKTVDKLENSCFPLAFATFSCNETQGYQCCFSVRATFFADLKEFLGCSGVFFEENLYAS